jgi:hypothetical protein
MLRDQRHLMEARDQLCPGQLCRGDEHPECADLLPALDREIPSVAFDLADSAGRPLPGATVVIDGQLAREAGARPVLLDPGAHALFIRVDGYAPIDKLITLSIEEKSRIVVRELLPIPAAVASRAVTKAKTPSGNYWPTIGYVLGGLGLAGLGVGAVLLAGFEQRPCGSGPCTASQLRDSHTRGESAMISLASGGALVIAGGALVLFPPRPSSKAGAVYISPLVATGGGGFEATGIW